MNNDKDVQPRFWCVVPAAGRGARFGADIPKQYLPLAGRTVFDRSLDRMLAIEAFAKVVVAIAPDDAWHQDSAHVAEPRLVFVHGGAERAYSVLNALQELPSLGAEPEDWVLVHDVARPCVRVDDILSMIDRAPVSQHGLVLGIPAVDTLKRTDSDDVVVDTPDRRVYWQAFTPQMFRLADLVQALADALAMGIVVTDEALAMERVGLAPQMHVGTRDNIKITHPDDLLLVEAILQAQARALGECE